MHCACVQDTVSFSFFLCFFSLPAACAVSHTVPFPPSPPPSLPPQTIMISDVDKLKRHIDPSQVTFDLGGYLPYNHEEWIKLRWVGHMTSHDMGISAIILFAYHMKNIVMNFKSMSHDIT